MTADRPANRVLVAIFVSIISAAVFFVGWREAIQLVAIPLDECIDLDAGGRFAFFVEWLALVFLSTALVVTITVPSALFGWAHLSLGWAICAVGLLAVAVIYLGDSATLY